MLDKVKSLAWFAWGLLKRFYYWVPFVLLDVADLWNRYFEPLIERITESDIEMPDSVIWAGFATGLAWSAALTYHEERMNKRRVEKEKDAEIGRLREELYPPDRRAEIRIGLRPIIDSGRLLLGRFEYNPPRHPDNPLPTYDEVGAWWDWAEGYVRDQLDEDALERVRTSPSGPVNYRGIRVHPVNKEIVETLCGRLTRLEELLKDLGG